MLNQKREEKQIQLVRDDSAKLHLTSYKVKAGESLSAIASKNNTTVKFIKLFLVMDLLELIFIQIPMRRK